MRDLTSNIQTAIASQKGQPIFLYELQLENTTKYYASYDRPIVWNSQTWEARDVTFDQITQDTATPLSRTTFKFDNADLTFSELFLEEWPEGKTLIVRVVFLNYLASASDYICEFRGEMQAPTFKGTWCEVPACQGAPLTREFPPLTYSKRCQRTFGDVGCNRSGYADITDNTDIYDGQKKMYDTGTGDAGSTTTVLVDADRDEYDDSWKYGTLEVTYGGRVERRKITASDQSSTNVTVDRAFPWNLEGKTYSIYAGCPKSWEACGDRVISTTVTAQVVGSLKTKFVDTDMPQDDDWIKCIQLYGKTTECTSITADTTSGTQLVLTVVGGTNAGSDTLTYAANPTVDDLIAAINALTPRTYDARRIGNTGTMQCTGLQQDTWNIKGIKSRKKIKIQEDYDGWLVIWDGAADDNYGEVCTVTAFNATTHEFTIDPATTNDISVGDSYCLRKWLYGAMFDNTANYLGFNDIGDANET